MFYIFVSAQAEHEGVISRAFTEQVCSTWAWYSTHVLFVIDFPINVLICNWKKQQPLHRDRTAFPYQKVSLLLFSVLTQCLTQPSSVNSWRALYVPSWCNPGASRNSSQVYSSECKCVVPAGRGAAKLSLSISHVMKLKISVWALLFQSVPVDSPTVLWMLTKHISDASDLDLRS